MQGTSAKRGGISGWFAGLREKQKAKPRDQRDQQVDSNGYQYVVLKGHKNQVYSVAFSPTNQLLASGSSDDTIRLWSTKSLGVEVATLRGHSGTIASVVFSPDGATLASGSWDYSVKLWSVEDKVEISTLGGHSGWVYSVAFSPDGAYLASGSKDSIGLWNVKSRIRVNVLKGHSRYVSSVAFSPDGTRLLSGSGDGEIRLWNVASKTTTATFERSLVGVMSVTFSPNGMLLASGSFDHFIHLWETTTGAYISELKAHSSVVNSVAFSPNGKLLASGSDDFTVRLWDVESRTLISTMKGHTNSVKSVAFSFDGSRLVSGSYDRTVRIWDISSEESVERGAAMTSDLIGPAPTTTDSQQDTITSALAQVTLNNNSTQSTPLPDSPATLQQDEVTSSSASVVLNNDITEYVSLEGSTPIGGGGFGELFLGVHKDRGKVALKKPRRLLDEALIRRFLREVDLWCSISHQYVLPCLGMCKVGLDVYVVSPYIENGDLLSCMARGQKLNRSKLLYEVAEALAHLHHKGIVHGDVKAQNILLSDDGSALLCDFGLAKAFDTMVTSTESKGAGSVRWMAPELCLGESRSMASDVYSLGITIAEILSGRTPFENISENLAVMFHVVYHDGRPPKEPMSSPEGKSYATLWETAEKYWVKDVKARPYMAQVLAMLFPITRE